MSSKKHSRTKVKVVDWADAHKFEQMCEFTSDNISATITQCQCSTIFTSSSLLRDHYIANHNEYYLQCPHRNCVGEKKKQNWQNYLCHIQSVKGVHCNLPLVQSQWYCLLPSCSLSFSSRNALEQHFERDFHGKKYTVVDIPNRHRRWKNCKLKSTKRKSKRNRKRKNGYSKTQSHNEKNIVFHQKTLNIHINDNNTNNETNVRIPFTKKRRLSDLHSEPNSKSNSESVSGLMLLVNAIEEDEAKNKTNIRRIELPKLPEFVIPNAHTVKLPNNVNNMNNMNIPAGYTGTSNITNNLLQTQTQTAFDFNQLKPTPNGNVLTQPNSNNTQLLHDVIHNLFDKDKDNLDMNMNMNLSNGNMFGLMPSLPVPVPASLPALPLLPMPNISNGNHDLGDRSPLDVPLPLALPSFLMDFNLDGVGVGVDVNKNSSMLSLPALSRIGL